METRKDGKGLKTFLENWWLQFIALVAILTMQISEFFTSLFIAGFVLMILGAA